MGEATQEVKRGPGLFAAEERRAIVRSFIEQYLGGKISIRYWSPNTNVIDITSGRQATGIEKAESKIAFIELLETVCKADSSDPAAVEAAVDSLFDQLVVYRSGGFMNGEFPVAPIAESRLSALEARTSSIEELLEELKNILKVKGP